MAYRLPILRPVKEIEDRIPPDSFGINSTQFDEMPGMQETPWSGDVGFGAMPEPPQGQAPQLGMAPGYTGPAYTPGPGIGASQPYNNTLSFQPSFEPEPSGWVPPPAPAAPDYGDYEWSQYDAGIPAGYEPPPLAYSVSQYPSDIAPEISATRPLEAPAGGEFEDMVAATGEALLRSLTTDVWENSGYSRLGETGGDFGRAAEIANREAEPITDSSLLGAALSYPGLAALGVAGTAKGTLRLTGKALEQTLAKAGGEAASKAVRLNEQLGEAGALRFGRKGPKQPWEMTMPDIEARFPRAEGQVDGMTVGANVPNRASIASSVDNPTELEGIRQVPVSAFEDSGPPTFYSATEKARTEKLAEQIRTSGRIDPLVIVDDGQASPYILEGGHRFDALKLLGAKSFPAKVVIDEDAYYQAVKAALDQGQPVPRNVLVEYPDLLAKYPPKTAIGKIKEFNEQLGEAGMVRLGGKKPEERLFYRGTVPGETARIDSPFAKGRLFVSDNPELAKSYGESIETIAAKPTAKILYEGTSEFRKVTGVTDVLRSLKKGEVYPDGLQRAIDRAEAAGYDAVHFSRQGDVGTVILQEDAFSRGVKPPQKEFNEQLGESGAMRPGKFKLGKEAKPQSIEDAARTDFLEQWGKAYGDRPDTAPAFTFRTENPLPITPEPSLSVEEARKFARMTDEELVAYNAKLRLGAAQVQPPKLEALPELPREEPPLRLGTSSPPAEPPKPPIAEGTPPMGPPPEGDPVEKMIRLLREAKPVRKEQELLYRKERGQRLGAYLVAREGATTEQGALRARGMLKGELPKAQYEPVKDQFTPEEVGSFFQRIEEASKNEVITKWEILAAEDGLGKMMMGSVPQMNELNALNRVFPGIAKVVMDKRGWGPKAWENFVAAANLPRSFLASMDLSGALRQGAFLSYGHPVIGAKNMPKMFKAFGSEKAAQATYDAIRADPLFEAAQEAGLDILHWSNKAVNFGQREEAFASAFASKIPGIKASERAYVTILNKLRWDVYKQRVSMWEKAGIDDESGLAAGKGLDDYQSLAKAVNILSGRGSLGQFNDSVIQGAFFSPRYVVSRFQAPLQIFSKNPEVRKEVARDLTAFFGTNIGLLTLADQAGIVDVEMDPRSSDFGKARIGNQRIDVFAGYTQIARFVAQTISEQRKATESGRVSEQDRLTTSLRFLQSKAAPALGLIVDLLRGETYKGDEMTADAPAVASQAYERLAPLFIQDMVDAIKEEGTRGAILAVPSAFGIASTTYPKTTGQLAMDAKNRAASTYFDGAKEWADLGPKAAAALRKSNEWIDQMEDQAQFENTRTGGLDQMRKDQLASAERIRKSMPPELGKEMDDLNMRVNLSRTAGDWSMNDARFQEYEKWVTQYVNQYAVQLTALPKYQNASYAKRRQMMEELVGDVTKQVRDYIKKEADKSTPLKLGAGAN